MAKVTKVLTREEKIQAVRDNLHVVDTSTRVKAWVFQVEKQYYVIIGYFQPLYGNTLEVFPSTRKGVKQSEKHILIIHNSLDWLLAFEKAIEILIPVAEPLQDASTILKD